MSRKMKVRIRFSQEISYDKTVEMSDKEFKKLSVLDQDEVILDCSNRGQLGSELRDWVSSSDINDEMNELTNISIETIKES